MNMLQAVKNYIKSSRVRNQYERVERAIRNKAQLASELEFHRTMGDFYSERVQSIDPHTDWWNFAEAKQKEYDHNEDSVRLSNRIVEADAKVNANKAAFLAMQSTLNENSTSN